MPPRFMLVNQVPKGNKYINLIDLNGKNIEKLLETIGSVQKNRIGRKTWIVAPASLHIEEETLIKNYFASNKLDLNIETSFYPHISMEDIPSKASDLALTIYSF